MNLIALMNIFWILQKVNPLKSIGFMKFFSGLFVLSTLLLACTQADQYRPPIEDLAGKWKGVDQSLNHIDSQLNQLQATLTALEKEIVADSQHVLQATHAPKLSGLVSSLNKEKNEMESFKKEFETFISEWESHSTMMKSLTDGLVSGNLPENFLQKIGILQGVVEGGRKKAEAMKRKLEVKDEEISSLKKESKK